MKKQVFNPYLPLDTYIPDGEPHVFGDRVYVYGSHDKEGGEYYCMLDYECWSAPVNDLTDWRCEGVIYRAEQCRHYSAERQDMYAPDVVQGNDGRYYLYYDLAGRDGHGFDGPISVAVCDTPAGKYEYYGDVRYSDGRPMLRYIPFDPAVINDDGHIWLYYGWGLGYDFSNPLMQPVYCKVMSKIFNKTVKEIRSEKESVLGANAVELEEDMLTVKTEPKRILPATTMAVKGTPIYDHSFYEAASIRKINGIYYFIYSSREGHELCYAISKYPDREFEYQGVIISNGDIGYQGRKAEDRLAVTGTNHGSIEQINGKYYIFYHRSTHNSLSSRQGCAEEIQIEPDGRIRQVEMTSCGLNQGPLETEGTYPAAIACNLTNGKMHHLSATEKNPVVPSINHDRNDRFVTAIDNGTSIGFKYFRFDRPVRMTVTTRGTGDGCFEISTELNGKPEITVHIHGTEKWERFWTEDVWEKTGEYALFFQYKGTGEIDFLEFEFS